MKLKEALHTAARHYLINRAAEIWVHVPKTAEEYGRVMRDPLLREENSRITAPWSIVTEFLTRIERATPHPPGTAEAVREWLIAEARRPPAWGRVERRGRVLMRYELKPERLALYGEEADRFEQHLRALSDAELLATEPLPYRRTLGDSEFDALWKELGQRWDTQPNSWYPSAKPDPPRERLHLRTSFVQRPEVLAALRRALFRLGVTRLYELSTDLLTPDCEIDLELFDPTTPRMGSDVFWTSPAMDWLIFGSHERMTTLIGEELVADFRRRVSHWPEGIWASIEDASR